MRYQEIILLTLEEVNGRSASLIWEDSSLTIVLTFAVTEAGIQKVYTILNPDKLTYIKHQLEARQGPLV